MAIADSTISGGDRFKAHVAAVRARPRIQSVEVGFWADSDRYEDGTAVTTVAVTHEYGGGDNVERAFMRRAQHRALPAIQERLAKTHGTPTHADADDVGRIVEDTIRDTITEVGLVETGKLKRSVRHKVNEGGTPGA